MGGKYLQKTKSRKKTLPFLLVPYSFFMVELFCFFFLSLDPENFQREQLQTLAFGGIWSVILGGFVRCLPWAAGRIVYGISYFLAALYAAFQTGYFELFSQMMWISDFRYASEGADYASALLGHPVGWWLGLVLMAALGIATVRWFPRWNGNPAPKMLAGFLACLAAVTAVQLPRMFFERDDTVRYAETDYGRSKSVEAAYTNMFNTHRLYQICGMYQTAVKDIYKNTIYPLTPSYLNARQQGNDQIEAYLNQKPAGTNAMTGVLEGKNVVLVLMESMDDWMIGSHTPVLNKLMGEGITFENFYTPAYGGIRTFNTEFCVNTGSYLSSEGGYAFDYVTNHYNQSLAALLTDAGYSAKTFHYNDPSFYSRGEFSPAMGYSEYVCYADYLQDRTEEERKQLLYDDKLLFDNPDLYEAFFREGKPTVNFVITRSAHLSYKYNEVLSYWGLKQYPEYKGMTGNEETDCAYLKARLVDDFFGRLLRALESEGQLENTVIIGVTDHYTYGYKNLEALAELSGTDRKLLMEKTPCFIWSSDLEPARVEKTANTADLLPTLLNLFGVETDYKYIGSDVFDSSYSGFVPFSDGSWIDGRYAFDASTKEVLLLNGSMDPPAEEYVAAMNDKVREFIAVNNLILNTDYYS